jgi:hypothetical protein
VPTGRLDVMSREALHDTIQRLDATIQKLDAHIGELSGATNAQLEFMRISMATLDGKLDTKASQSSVDAFRADIRAVNQKLDRMVQGNK